MHSSIAYASYCSYQQQLQSFQSTLPMQSHAKYSHTPSTVISVTSPFEPTVSLRHAKLNQRVVIRKKMRKEKTFFQEERGEGEEGSEGKGKQSGTAIRQWALTTTEGFVGRYEDKLKINMARKSGMLRRLSLRGPERIELSQSATLNITSPTFFPNKTASLCRPATEPTPIFKTTALSFSAQPVSSQQTISEYVYRRLTVKRNFEEGKQAQYKLLPGCVKHGGEKGKEMAKMNNSIKSKLFSDYQTAPHLDAMQF